MRLRTAICPLIALVVLVIELGGMLSTIGQDSFSPVDGWGSTRATDALAVAMVVLGCAVIALFRRAPRTVALIATASYVVVAVRDYELGLLLPPMVVSYLLVVYTRHHGVAITLAAVNLGVSLTWVAHRTAALHDPGVSLLAWTALGTVFAVFFFAPVLAAHLVRMRSLLRSASTAPRAVELPDG